MEPFRPGMTTTLSLVGCAGAGGAATGSVEAEYAVAEPSEFVAVTRLRRRLPTSASDAV